MPNTTEISSAARAIGSSTPVGMGASLALSLGQTIYGAVEAAQGRKMAKRNIRPTSDQASLYEDLLSNLYSQAQYGLDANALAFSTEKNQNAFGAALNTIGQTGGSPNDVTSAYATLVQGNNELAIADSERRWQKVNAVAKATEVLGEARKEDFLYNEDAPYKDTAQLAGMKQAQGYQNMFTGLDTMVGAAINSEAGKFYRDNRQNIHEEGGMRPTFNPDANKPNTNIPRHTPTGQISTKLPGSLDPDATLRKLQEQLNMPKIPKGTDWLGGMFGDTSMENLYRRRP